MKDRPSKKRGGQARVLECVADGDDYHEPTGSAAENQELFEAGHVALLSAKTNHH